MIIYKDKIYAKPGYYLQNNKGECNYSLPYSEDDEYTEIESDIMESPLPGYYKIFPRYLYKVKDNANIKGDLIRFLWSNDEQIAIMLNKDRSEEDLAMYNFMQEYRTYFSKLAKQIKELETVDKN